MKHKVCRKIREGAEDHDVRKCKHCMRRKLTTVADLMEDLLKRFDEFKKDDLKIAIRDIIRESHIEPN